MPSRTATILTTALAPLIWGNTYLVTTEFLPPDRPFTAALIRVLPAGLLLLAWTRRIPKRDEWATVVLLGFLNIGFFQAMLFVAAYRLPGGLAAVLSSTQTLMVLVFTWLIGKTMPPKAAWAWSAAGFWGLRSWYCRRRRAMTVRDFGGIGGRGGDGVGRLFVETPPHFVARVGVHRLAAFYRRLVFTARRPACRTAA